MRIYLDQAKWIDLARARLGHPMGVRFADAYDAALEAVRSGSASFPLSAIHYIETNKRRNYASRHDLAITMALLSRFETIAPFPSIVPGEVDEALKKRFGTPEEPRDKQVFGYGVEHAMQRAFPASDFGNLEGVPPPVADSLRRQFEFGRQIFALEGLPPEAGLDESGFDAGQEAVGNELAQGQEEVRQARLAAGFHRGREADENSALSVLRSWREEITEAAERAGLQWADIDGLGNDEKVAFVADIPLLSVGSQLERQRELAVDKPWDSHDVNDVYHLMPAIVYCDIVVTERQWVDLVRRSGIDAAFSTTMLHDVGSLTEQLRATDADTGPAC